MIVKTASELVSTTDAAEVSVVAGRIGPEESDTDDSKNSTGPTDPIADALTTSEVTSVVPLATDMSKIEEVVTIREVEPVQPLVTTTSNSDELFWAEVSLIADLAHAEEERLRVETELRDAKSKAQRHEKALEELRVRIPEIEQEMRDAREQSLTVAHSIYVLTRQKKLPVKAVAAVPEATTTKTQDAQPSEPPANELTIAAGWRDKLTKELLEGVKGIRKLPEILELLPTAGHIEDLRGEAGKEHKQFKDMLPKGSGQATADLIEEALFRHQKQFLQGGKVDSTFGLAEELVKSIRALACNEPWRPEDCTPDESDSATVHTGFAAFKEGKPYTALPTKNAELGREWMVGWVCGEVIAANATPEPKNESPKAEASSEVQPL